MHVDRQTTDRNTLLPYRGGVMTRCVILLRLYKLDDREDGRHICTEFDLLHSRLSPNPCMPTFFRSLVRIPGSESPSPFARTRQTVLDSFWASNSESQDCVQFSKKKCTKCCNVNNAS